MSEFNIEAVRTPGLKMSSGTGTSGLGIGGGKEYYTKPQADELFARKAEVKGKQNQLSPEQLQNIADVPSKADKTDVSNAVKGTASGNTLTLSDISPIEHVMNIKVRSKNIIPWIREDIGEKTTIDGLTFTRSTQGKITVTSESSPTDIVEYPFISADNPLILQGGVDYTVSGVCDGSGIISLRINDTTNNISYDITNEVETIRFNGNESVSCEIFIIVSAGALPNATLTPQIEIGTEATTYTPYAHIESVTVTRYGADETDNAKTYTPLADGTVEGVYSLHPITTLTTNQKTRVLIDCVYNKDINSVLADKSDILALQNDVNANKEKISDVEAIAKGRATGYVFDTKDDMDAWLTDSENVVKLVLGDNLYIRATDVPDYWWDGTAAQELETQKVDLSEYASKEYVDNGLAGKQDQLSDEQLENIEDVPSKADKTEVSNVVTETVTGKAIVLDDVSPLTDTISVKVSSFCNVYVSGQNVWGETWSYDGTNIVGGFRVTPNVDYYLCCNSPAYDLEDALPLFEEIAFLDKDAEVVLETLTDIKRNSTITPPEDCYFIRFKLATAYGDTYKNDICINVFDERINGTYAPFWRIEKLSPIIINNTPIVTVDKQNQSVLTFWTYDLDEYVSTTLTCEYAKDIKGVVKTIENRLARLEMLLGVG